MHRSVGRAELAEPLTTGYFCTAGSDFTITAEDGTKTKPEAGWASRRQLAS